MAPPFDLPTGPALVRATLLVGALAASASARAQTAADAPPNDHVEQPHPIEAPTCGPCCHGSAGCEDELLGLPQAVELVDVPFVGIVERYGERVTVREPLPPFVVGDRLLAHEGRPIQTLGALATAVLVGTVTVERAGERVDLLVSDPRIEEEAPTCGPCCHGADCDDERELYEPPVEPSRREQRRAERALRREERRREREE